MQAQAKTRFKKTPIGEIPEDWEVVRLKDVLLILRNGLTSRQNKEGVGYPITRIETIAMERIDPSKVGFVENVSPKDLEKYRLYPGDILFSHINSLAHIGKTAIYEGKPNLLLHGMNLLLLRPDNEKIESWYLLWLLKFYRERGIFKNIAKKAVNQASINQTELGKLKIPLPPLPEQKKIAEILRTVDEAIEKTDEAIERTERLKKGLMQRLLTKGIRHERFKKTELGEISEEWRVVRLEELLTAIQDTPHKVPKKTKSGIPFVSVNYVLQFPDYNFYIDPTKEGIEYISEDNAEFLNKFNPEPGDIIYTKWGTPGVAKLVNTRDRFVGLCSLALLKPKHSIVYPLFLVYALNSNATRKQIIPHSKTSTRTEIHKKHIRNILIPLPPLQEQKQIAEILSTVDRKLELLRKRREKLELVKRGMMKELLTGKRRVRVE
ncbi:restriction endonuclease subunit S [Thermococcus sp.]